MDVAPPTDLATDNDGPFCEFHGRRHVCDADWSSWFRPPRIVARTLNAPPTNLADLIADVEKKALALRELLDDIRADIATDPLAEYRGPDGAVLYQTEHARWVQRGDYIQAGHGDTEWEPVVSTVHADNQTGIVTMTATGTRLRWWAHDDLVRVATAPVPDPAPYRFVSDGPMPAGVTDVEPW
jgi:hypothetical protein